MYFDYKKDIEYVKTILGLSDTEFANMVGISRMSLNRWKNDEVVPSYESLEKMYNIFYEKGIYLNRIKEEMYKSDILNNHIILFHGSKNELIGNPSIEYSDSYKDFGKGFYLGETFNQSASFVNGYEKSSVYVFDFDMKDVRIKEFNVSKEWMLLIAYFRGRLNEYKSSNYITKLVEDLKKYDVVIAPIADNQMYTTLDDFISGKITDLQCLNALDANRLGRQYVFLNDEVINNKLVMKGRFYYCSSEKNDYRNYRLKESEVGKNKVKIALREYAGKGKYIEEMLDE
ncbi:MAG: DUF3990 domain-containing protein [Acholeplasmatales bacterium]|nr:DUF3990 domain-containing protein [Acholeplasmatales bacterium]